MFPFIHFSIVARHAGRSKPGSKPDQLYVRLSFRPLCHQADQGNFKVFYFRNSSSSLCLHFLYPIGYHIYIYIYIYIPIGYHIYIYILLVCIYTTPPTPTGYDTMSNIFNCSETGLNSLSHPPADWLPNHV